MLEKDLKLLKNSKYNEDDLKRLIQAKDCALWDDIEEYDYEVSLVYSLLSIGKDCFVC